MRRVTITFVMSLAIVAGLALSTQVMAQEPGQKIFITRDSKIGGETVSKGDYVVKFDASKDGELVLVKGKRDILKATYRLTKLDQRPASDSVVFTQNSDGSFQVKRIEFKGKDTALVLQDTLATAISK